MGYKVVLLDFDDTLVDFHDAEVKAFHHLMNQYRVPESKRDYESFKKINQAHWEAFQRDELTKAEVLSHRFIETFRQYGMTIDGHEADVTFRDGLATAKIKWHEGVEQALDYLKSKYTLAIATNGVTHTQKRRIAQTDLMSYVDHLFISDEMGAQKPSRQFFEIVFNTMPHLNANDFIIIGDSLTSDIQGGINGGIDTIWFNHKNVENNTPITPTYTINTMHEIEHIL
ncbi:HAD-superfamily hydrolase [Staphylococcus agnetis]|uniref:YjjG family noncanonical pyrimidine nucleotidase n=1 Tax=Staphylococcus agnetis TaxID=985762 RepID=UPI000DFC0396|nr:YjjG family noncanonical pyrimidine nucleotidase [Staphylococcus agnetis]SUK17559.1 HAD-superfamily hydrolase [Staphylococcus agnetis]